MSDEYDQGLDSIFHTSDDLGGDVGNKGKPPRCIGWDAPDVGRTCERMERWRQSSGVGTGLWREQGRVQGGTAGSGCAYTRVVREGVLPLVIPDESVIDSVSRCTCREITKWQFCGSGESGENCGCEGNDVAWPVCQERGGVCAGNLGSCVC